MGPTESFAVGSAATARMAGGNDDQRRAVKEAAYREAYALLEKKAAVSSPKEVAPSVSDTPAPAM
jgi:hypothetical protein